MRDNKHINFEVTKELKNVSFIIYKQLLSFLSIIVTGDWMELEIAARGVNFYKAIKYSNLNLLLLRHYDVIIYFNAPNNMPQLKNFKLLDYITPIPLKYLK